MSAELTEAQANELLANRAAKLSSLASQWGLKILRGDGSSRALFLETMEDINRLITPTK